MPRKTEEYLALAQRTANGLTRYWESWTDYLTTASRLYKYSFADQLMIYAQRPDATACADFDIWNNRMNRYVRRGAKGIALLDESSGFPRLHYVFDVSDTGVRRNSRDPEVWQLNDDLFQPVSEMLAQEYGIHHERLSQQIADIAGKLAESYWDNNSTDILAIVDGSFLMDYDDAGQELQFKSAAAISIMYTILERCGFEPEGYFDRDDFQAIYDFSTPDAVYALGTAVSDCSRDVLRNIERTVKTTIRRRNVERSQHEYEEQERDLLNHRGLPAPEPDPQPAEDPVGQVRQDAPDVPDEPSPGAVQHDAPEWEPVPAPDGSGADSREPDAADHGAASETDPGPGQGEPANGMGAAHEQPESAGRGTGADGADLQLSFFDAHIPTEAQQIEKIDQAESEKTPSAFVLSQAEIENELRKHGSGFAGGKQRIMALYQTQPDRKLRAKALAKEYGIGGHSHDFLDGSRGFVNHDWKGLEFDHYPDHQKITLKWAQVEKYIDLMIQSDRYLTDEEKEQCATVQEENGYKVGDDVMVDLPTGTIEGTIGYIGETDVRIDTSAHGQSWDNEVINKRQFEDGLRQNEPSQRVDEMLAQAETIYKESEVPEYERFSVREVVGGTSPLFAIWDDLNEGYYANDNGMAQFPDKEQAESYCTALKKETDERTAADWLAVEKAKFLAENEPVLALPKERDYRVGDTIRLDGKDFTVETVGTLNIQLRDPDEVYPVARSESKENLERLLRQPGNIHLHNLTVNLTPAPEPAGNFHIMDNHLGEGGAKQKYTRNIKAIKTLFRLEEEHRGASAEEQQVLSQYVGWGGLADAFDPSKDSWAKEYAELKGLLSEDEYAAARSSTLNAHYTSPTVIRGIYDAVERMGFRSGNILEPSMGVGNFFGMLPDTMADSRLYGVELDSITGRIAKMLYPQADITVAGFETTDRRDFYDLAVGNVPFGQYKVNDKAYNKLGFSIHNYFFAKAIDQIRPGGVIAFVTSRYTMDSKDSTARKHMAERADLLGAIRLPNNAFRANAGTDVVSDIIFLQKRDRPADIEPAWVQLGKTEDGFAINQYFVDHPEMVLGVLSTESTQYGREELTVAPIEGANLADQLAEAVQHIEGQYTEVEVKTPDIADAENEKHILPADPDVKNFSYTVVDGEVFYRENSVMTQVELSDAANVYDDIRKKLIAAGVPENEIEFIHNADTEAKKAALFSKVRSGDVRVLLGSTAKMGAGTNVQQRLVAVHHLDVGWKPSDMTQRNGRIIRQGNMNKEVKVFNYVTEGTFDSYLYQTLENKQRFISQIMTSKSPVRSCEDVDEQALSYAEIKALCAGNPLIKEKMDLDVQVAKLKVLKADHQSQKFRLQDKLLTKFPADIQETNAHIAGLKADAQLAAAHPQGKEEFCGMVIKGVAYDEKKTAGERLVLACSELPNAEEKVIGSYRGFELSLRFDTYRSEYQAILKGQRRYPVALGTDPLGNIIRLDNSLNNFPERINSAENELATLHQQQAAAQIEVEKPFPQEEELAEKSARLAELNAQLDVDEKSHEPEQDEEEQEDVPRRPSVLAALDEKKDEAEPVRPFKSYLDKDGDAR